MQITVEKWVKVIVVGLRFEYWQSDFSLGLPLCHFGVPGQSCAAIIEKRPNDGRCPAKCSGAKPVHKANGVEYRSLAVLSRREKWPRESPAMSPWPTSPALPDLQFPRFRWC